MLVTAVVNQYTQGIEAKSGSNSIKSPDLQIVFELELSQLGD